MDSRTAQFRQSNPKFHIFYEIQKSVKPTSPVPVFKKWMEKETLEESLRLGGFINVNIEEQETLIRGRGFGKPGSGASGQDEAAWWATSGVRTKKPR